MRLKLFLESKTPKDYVKDYMENMFNDGVHEEYKTWKDFFQAAKNGAYDWSEELDNNTQKVNIFRDKILKVSPSSFSKDKKYFEDTKV